MTPCRQEQKSESYRFRQPVPSLPHEKQQQEPTPLKTPLRAAAPQKFLIPPGPPDPCSRPPRAPCSCGCRISGRRRFAQPTELDGFLTESEAGSRPWLQARACAHTDSQSGLSWSIARE